MPQCEKLSFSLCITNAHAVACVTKGLCRCIKSTVALYHFSQPVKPAVECDVVSV